jgi:hypothetical protein
MRSLSAAKRRNDVGILPVALGYSVMFRRSRFFGSAFLPSAIRRVAAAAFAVIRIRYRPAYECEKSIEIFRMRESSGTFGAGSGWLLRLTTDQMRRERGG